MIKALGVAVTAALFGLSAVSCGQMGTRDDPPTRASGGASADPCAGLSGGERQRCVRMRDALPGTR